MRISDLKQKEVINVGTCKCLGCVADILLDTKSGHIIAIIIPGPGKIYSLFGRDTEYIIPWKHIKQIGEDIILVEINEEDVLIKCE